MLLITKWAFKFVWTKGKIVVGYQIGSAPGFQGDTLQVVLTREDLRLAGYVAIHHAQRYCSRKTMQS